MISNNLNKIPSDFRINLDSKTDYRLSRLVRGTGSMTSDCGSHVGFVMWQKLRGACMKE